MGCPARTSADVMHLRISIRPPPSLLMPDGHSQRSTHGARTLLVAVTALALAVQPVAPGGGMISAARAQASPGQGNESTSLYGPAQPPLRQPSAGATDSDTLSFGASVGASRPRRRVAGDAVACPGTQDRRDGRPPDPRRRRLSRGSRSQRLPERNSAIGSWRPFRRDGRISSSSRSATPPSTRSRFPAAISASTRA